MTADEPVEGRGLEMPRPDEEFEGWIGSSMVVTYTSRTEAELRAKLTAISDAIGPESEQWRWYDSNLRSTIRAILEGKP